LEPKEFVDKMDIERALVPLEVVLMAEEEQIS
jgi:hypothetical protein